MLYDELTIEELLIVLKFHSVQLYHKLFSEYQIEYIESFTEYKIYYDKDYKSTELNIVDHCGIWVAWPVRDHIWSLSNRLVGTSKVFYKSIKEIKIYLKEQARQYLEAIRTT